MDTGAVMPSADIIVAATRTCAGATIMAAAATPMPIAEVTTAEWRTTVTFRRITTGPLITAGPTIRGPRRWPMAGDGAVLRGTDTTATTSLLLPYMPRHRCGSPTICWRPICKLPTTPGPQPRPMRQQRQKMTKAPAAAEEAEEAEEAL